MAGDAGLGERFVALVDPLRYPADGLTEADVREIRRIKARVEAERLPRGADPAPHTKLGRGGLADVEWTVQLLQLRHGAAVPRAAHDAHAGGPATRPPRPACSTRPTRPRSAQAWRLATRVRNAIVLVRGRPDDTLPGGHPRAGGRRPVRRLRSGAVQAQLVEDYLRTTRRARAVVERVFYA